MMALSDDGFSWAYATKGFHAEGDNQVSLLEGDQVELLNDHDRNWWLIRLKDKTGYVPADSLELAWEREARLNLRRNEELTRWRPELGESPWWKSDISASGFYRTPKRVSFEPEQQVMEYEREEPFERELHSPRVVAMPKVPMDAQVEQLLKDWLEDDDISDDAPLKSGSVHGNEAEDTKGEDLQNKRQQVKEVNLFEPSKEKASLWSRIRGKRDARVPESEDGQLVRIYAGNFEESGGGYRSLMLYEDNKLDEVASQALEKFLPARAQGSEEFYRLACVNSETGEMLPVDGRCTIGHIVECAKLLTAREILADSSLTVSKRSRKLAKQCLKRMQGADLAKLLPRHRPSDFGTPFQFILNRESCPFYLRLRLGKMEGRVKVSNLKDPVSLLVERGLEHLQVTRLPGIHYLPQLTVDAPRAKQLEGHPLAMDEAIGKIFSVWPLVDASFLCISLYPQN